MRTNDGQRRRVRLLSECEVNAGPVLLLAAAAAIMLVVALFAGTASAQPAQPTQRADAGENFDAAMQAYERNHWEAAYAPLRGSGR